MTKRQLIDYLESIPVSDDAEVVMHSMRWVDGALSSCHTQIQSLSVATNLLFLQVGKKQNAIELRSLTVE